MLPMRIITLNVNGIRSAERKGLARWLARDRAVGRGLPAGDPRRVRRRAQADAGTAQVARALSIPRSAKATAASPCTRTSPPTIRTGFGSREFDAEGRYLEADFGKLAVISVYLPSGSRVARSARRRSSAFSPSSCRTCEAARRAAAKSSCAATGTSRTSRSTSRTGAATRRIPASCPRSARG